MSPDRYRSDVRYQVLGPIRVTTDEEELPLGGRQQRLVLALLIGAEGRAVAAERLIEDIWGEEIPATARKTLQGYVYHLRSGIGEALKTEAGGYSLATNGDVDAIEFTSLHRKGKDYLNTDPGQASELLRDALGVWNGPAYADLSDEIPLFPEIARLENLRTTALGDRIDADLELGRHENLIGELEGLTYEYAYQERFRAQHMTALYRAGRQTEALRSYERMRRFLADESGLEPSAELQQLEERILSRDEDLLATHSQSESGPTALRGYELREKVSADNEGETYRAYQRSVGRQVSLRLLSPAVADNPEFIANFLADTERVAAIEHPNVAPIFDTWREPGAAYQVSRWLDGGSLSERVAAGNHGLSSGLRAIEEVGEALGQAHRRGLVHGRLSAESVLFDEGDHAYLSGFAVGLDLTNGDPRDDIVDLARLAHLAFSGRPPASFDGRYRAQLGDTELPEAVATVLDLAFEEDYDRVDGLLRALRQAAGTDVVAAREGLASRSDARNPYKGLQAFQESDAADFFGRSELIEDLLSKMSSHPLVAVVGPSGSGKSSVVKAGLLPRMRDASSTTFIAEMYPGAFPFEELESALLRIGINRTSLIEDLLADDRGLLRVIKQVLPTDDGEILLVIDQFEELFSAVEDESTRRLFLDSLTNALSDPRSRLRVVLTMRADFFDKPLEHSKFGALVKAGLVPVTIPNDAHLTEAITNPARSVGVDFEAGLVPQIVNDVSGQPGALPLLQYALTELFDARDEDQISFSVYQRTGGVLGALGKRGEELFQQLGAGAQVAVREALLRMVTVDENADDLRRRVRRSELADPDLDVRALDEALRSYAAHRLLTFDRDPVTRGPTVEVAHEALLREWDRLRGWIEEQRDDLVIRRRLDAALNEWLQADRDQSYLPSGSRLAQFDEWATETSLRISSDEREFLQAGVEREAEQKHKAARRRRNVLVGLSAFSVALAVFLVVAFVQKQRADTAAFSAETGRLASDAAIVVEPNPALGLLLAAEAYQRSPGPDTLGSLQRVMTRTELLGFIGDGALEVEWASDRIVTLDQDGITVYDSESRDEILSVPLDVRVLPAPFGTELAESDGAPSVFAVSNSGRWAAVGVTDGGAELIDLDTGETQQIRQGNAVTEVTFGNTQDILAVGDDRGDIAIYTVPGLDSVLAIPTADGKDSLASYETFASQPDLFVPDQYVQLLFRGVSSLAFDGNDALIASGDGPRVRIWSAETGDQVGEEAVQATWDFQYPIFAFDLQFAGDELVARGLSTATRIDPSDGEVLSVTEIPTGRAFGDLTVATTDFQALGDGKALALLSDGRAVLFDITNSDDPDYDPELSIPEPTVLREFTLPITPTEGVGVSPHGRQWVASGHSALVLGSLDGQRLLADALPGGPGSYLAISGDGSTVANTTAWDSAVWQFFDGAPVQLEVPENLREAVAAQYGVPGTDVAGLVLDTNLLSFGADGFALTQRTQVGADSVLHIYDGLTFESTETSVEDIWVHHSASPDGRFFAYERCAGDDHFDWCESDDVGVVDLETGMTVTVLSPGLTSSLDWSTDGSRLIHTTTDGVATVWETDTWTVVDSPRLGRTPGETLIARYSPDGSYLATVNESGVVSLRDPSSGEELSTMTGAASVAGFTEHPLLFSLDSTLMLTTFDGSVRLWDTVEGVQIGDSFRNDIGISPGGAEGDQIQLVTSVGDQMLIWNLDTSTWYDIACQAAGRNMTRDEWEQFGPTDSEYRATCPQYGIEE